MESVDTFRVHSTPADFAAAAAAEATQADAMFAVLSDVACDTPAGLNALRLVLGGFVSSGSIPAVFILMGDFLHSPSGSAAEDAAAFTIAMDSLASLLCEFPEVTTAAHFVLIPGPGDPGAAPVLPRPPLPAALCPRLLNKNHLPRLTLATNPCRLRFFTQEIFVFRGDVSTRLARASALAPDLYIEENDEGGGDDSSAQRRNQEKSRGRLSMHVAETIISQGHVLPLSIASQPVYWEFDHALRLSPTPDAVIIGEDQDFWSNDFNESIVFCPGSFSANATFAVFRPGMRTVEESCLNHENEDE